MDWCSCHVFSRWMAQFNLLLNAALQCKEPDCSSLYSNLLSPFYCSNLCTSHMGSPSGHHTEMKIQLPNTFCQSVGCHLNQILIAFHSSVAAVEQFSVIVITWRLKLVAVICLFFICLAPVWCSITGHALGGSCPFAWQTLASCTGTSCREPWPVSPASAASSRMMLISSAPWTRWGQHWCVPLFWSH